jgi:predicted rRNA methylase YqxC with S4 and FtsJ domains
MINFYQSIPELNIKGRFDMEAQFKAIGLPEDLKGQSVLDIGCNTGAFLIEALKRGASKCVGVEVNQNWRLLGNGIMVELDLPIRIYSRIKPTEKFDVVLLLSVTHVAEGISGQDLLNQAYKIANKLLILEINDRLQKEKLILPQGAKLYGANKDNRSVYKIFKS